MRKIFTTLKSVIAIAVIASMTLAASCSYDDSAINKRVDKVQKDLTALVERVEKLEESLQQQAPTLEELLGNKAVIVEVTTNEAGDTIIKLSNGKEITVLAPADSLQYRVVDGVLEVSADGENWIVVNGVTGEQVVADVVISEDGKTATVILADGQEFVVGVAELIEFEGARDQVYVIAGASKEIAFAINDAVAEINIMNQPFGWSAEVEALDETRAVGGKNFVLKINGPAQELVAAGYAAKEGVVSVHFNTEAGACKVAKVNVNLAEIKLDVDAKGNITLTNTVALEQTNYFGEVFFNFADWFIGIVDAEDYATYGDSVFADTFDDMMWGYTSNVASTQRTSGFGNVVDLQQYEEGVCEKESYTFTVDQLAGAFWPAYTLEYGKEYIIFATLDSEMVGYQVHPVLKSAVKETYKKTLVQASYVADSATWNNATFNFALAGFQYYLVGWVPTATVDEYISSGQLASVEEFVPFYIQGNSLMSSGAILSGNYSNQEIALADLAAYSMTQWAPELSAGTEYVFYIYAFNAANEMELYQHTVVADNVFIFDNFATAELVAGEFDAAAVAEVVEYTAKSITVNVAFSEDVVTVAYNWFDAPFADAEEAAAAILADFYTTYVTFDEYTTYVEANKYNYYGLPEPIYLGMLAINADGQYVYVEKEFAPEPLPEVAITSFEYLGRHWEIADEDPDTNGGEFVYLAKCADGNEYKINIYYAYCNADGSIIEGTYDYCTNMPDYMYSYWAGFAIISDTKYEGSKLVVAADKITLTLAGVAEYVYIPGQGGEQPVEDSFTYLGRYYDIDDDDSTSGGDYVYKVVAGGVEYQLGLYWAYAETDGTIKAGVYNYCYNAFDVMYSGWDGFIIKSDSYYYGSTLTAKADGVTLHLTDADGNLIGDYFFAGVPVSGDFVEPEEPVEDSFTYLGRYYDLDDDDSTSNGNYMYKVVAGGVEYSLELYWDYADTTGAIKVGTYDYCYNQPDAMYSSWNGFSIISDSYYHGSTLKATADGVVTLTLKDADGNLIGEYVYTGIPTFGEEPEQPELPAFDSVVFTTSVLDAGYGYGDMTVFLSADNGLMIALNFYNCQDADKNFLPADTYTLSTNAGIYHAANYSYARWNETMYGFNDGSVTVSEVNGAYKFDIALVADTLGAVNGTFEGVIDGLVVPSEWVEPEPPAMQETTEWTIDYHSTSWGGKPGYSSHEIYFWVNASTYAKLEFKNVDSEGRVLPGTYDFDNGLNSYYCTTNEGSMTSCTVVVTDGEDANSKNFDVTFVVDEYKPYHFTYSSTIYPVE